MSESVFKYPISDNKIVINCAGSTAIIKEMFFDVKYPKIYFNMIADLEKKLIEENIEYVFQEVTNNDYNESLKDKTTWETVGVKYDHNNGLMLLVKCKTRDLLENVHSAFLT